MTCVNFRKPVYEEDIECTVKLTSTELTILSNAMHYYCKQEGKELLLAHELHRDIYGINSFIRAGRLVTDDGALALLDKEIKRLRTTKE